MGFFIILIVLVLTGYRAKSTDTQVNNVSDQAASIGADAALPVVTLGEAQSANLAATAALASDLSSSNSVSNKSASLNASVALNQPDTTTANKPQIADLNTVPEPIASYTTQDNDTAATVATKFGVSDQTVRWANNLTSDTVAAGTVLTVPVVDGVVYTVKDGDSLSAIATKYQSDVDEIMSVNNLSDQNVAVGTKLLLPGGVLPANEQPGYKAPTATSSSSNVTYVNMTYATAAVGNRYAYGYCTWYAYNRRMELGMPIGSLWGNASTWAAYARAAGYVVDHTPSVGAVMQSTGGYGGMGHVAIVESINADGSIVISEMNGVAGWNRIDYRTVTNPSAYNFIH